MRESRGRCHTILLAGLVACGWCLIPPSGHAKLSGGVAVIKVGAASEVTAADLASAARAQPGVQSVEVFAPQAGGGRELYLYLDGPCTPAGGAQLAAAIAGDLGSEKPEPIFSSCWTILAARRSDSPVAYGRGPLILRRLQCPQAEERCYEALAAAARELEGVVDAQIVDPGGSPVLILYSGSRQDRSALAALAKRLVAVAAAAGITVGAEAGDNIGRLL